MAPVGDERSKMLPPGIQISRAVQPRAPGADKLLNIGGDANRNIDGYSGHFRLFRSSDSEKRSDCELTCEWFVDEQNSDPWGRKLRERD